MLLQRKPLQEILRAGKELTAEQNVDLATNLRTLVLLQEFPDIALIALSEIALPPHQRTLLYVCSGDVQSVIIVASRGTAKSSTVLVLYANHRALLFPRTAIVELSSGGFRSGQMQFLDAERWIKGGWDDQQMEVPFFRASVPRPQLLNKSANFWQLEYDSFGRLLTLPTKDPDAIRGHRGNELMIDEANFADAELIDKVATPFLNVKKGFRTGGSFEKGNKAVLVSTIDFNWRDFQKRVQAARDGVTRDIQYLEAAKKADWERCEELEQAGICEYAYAKFDYTDLLIRNRVKNRKGEAFEIQWPNSDIPLTKSKRGIPFIERDEEDSSMKKFGGPREYFSTYPVDRDGLERSLFDGSIDEASWLSEQRNVVDSAIGDVYPQDVVDRAACVGDRCIIPYNELPPAWKTKYKEESEDYTSPLLWRCMDPCVLGLDYAPESDFCAFVVIRVGPLAQGGFNPFTHLGKTQWSSVIWAEQHLKMSHEDAAEKARQLCERYNIIHFFDPHVKDPWDACRGIGLDMRGGGSGVRDALCFINDEVVPVGKYRIYDPLDPDERIQKFGADTSAKPMLDSIKPTDELNDRLVEYTLGQLQQGFLYIGKYLDISQRPKGQRELHIGFDAMRSLESQLRKLRQAPTKNYRTFYIEGDTRKTKNKKDLWSAFIYAGKEMRAHIIRQRLIENTPPPMGGRVTRVGSGRRLFGGRVPGARD